MDPKSRSGYIGGSDAAGVMAMSRWDTPLSVWAEKTGQFIKPEVESEAAELGRELEDYVAKRFERKMAKKVARAPGTYFHPEHGFLGANVDRVIEGEDAGLECKTASAWKSKEWEGEEIPQEYIIQCYHYMMVTGKKKWYLAVLIGNQDFKIKELGWDEQMIRTLREREVEFWDKFVLPVVMPTQITKHDADTLAGIFPVAVEGASKKLGDDANITIETLGALKQDLKNIEGLIDQNENELKAMMGDAEIGDTGLYKVSWTNMRVRRFDVKDFEAKHPELAQQFRPEKLTRRFSYKPIKGEQK